ncbi:MAG: hypothetical protein U0836_18825 [Pirellulales bacterium]
MNDKLDDLCVYGAFASVRIRYAGTLEQLASLLASGLNIKPFVVQPMEDPPHGEVGMIEALGWEVWLQADSADLPHHFQLRIETEDSLTEAFEERMYNLSPWFARLLGVLCDLEATPDMPCR